MYVCNNVCNVSMYVCMYVRTYVCMYVCVYVCMYVRAVQTREFHDQGVWHASAQFVHEFVVSANLRNNQILESF